MKKIILVSLFTLFAVTSAFGAYAVSGVVKDESGNLVNGATVYINCYPAAGGSYSDTDTSNAVGFYSGGWLDKNCNGEKMVVKAVKGNKSGSVTWNAGGVVDVKNITIRAPMIATAELHCEPEPVSMSEPITQPSMVMLYAQLAAPGPILVNGGTTDMHYETETMSCSGVAPNPPFDASFSFYIDPVAGTIHVEAYAPPGLFAPVENGEHPTPFFTLLLNGHSGNPGQISNVTVTNSVIVTDTGSISTFPSRTEYVIGEPNDKRDAFFRLDTEPDWTEALSSGHVYAMEREDWEYYMFQWEYFLSEGDPYPATEFIPAIPPEGDLYVYGGGGGSGGALDPCDAGLVMYWGNEQTVLPDGPYASAWKYDYLLDPDLSNCIITVAVTAPQLDMSGNQINQVSFGLQNIPNPGGPVRSWYWNCGPMGSGAPIIWNTPTVITIDTSKVGLAAATPVANGYMNNPGFDIKTVQWILLDENGNWVNGGSPAPAPGTGMVGLWNYWHWLMISPKTTLAKGYYTKWSQPPVVVDTNDPPVFLGWDERSWWGEQVVAPHVVADDWECKDDRPVTDIHWWGSFIGWNQPYLPQVMLPQAFHIGIWTDVPDDPCVQGDFSHPGMLVWENYCDNYVWNFAGYDRDPRQQGGPGEPEDSCFQFNQLLSQNEWFYQEPSEDPCHPRIYWLSIAPVWGGVEPQYQWGWKTRPHYFNDDAVVITDVTILPPALGTVWTGGYPIQWPPWPDPEGATWDVAFELTTNEPGPPSADLNNDGIVDFFDFAIFANQWLTAGP